MNANVNIIANRLSLRKPQRDSLEILARLCEIVSLEKSAEPNFVVETRTAKFLCEPKAANEMTAEDVLAKAKAAAQWCAHATAHEKQHGGKPWAYLLIPHDAIADNKTLQGLAATYTYGGASGGKR